MIERVTAAIENAMRQEYWNPKSGQAIVDYAVVARAAIEVMDIDGNRACHTCQQRRSRESKARRRAALSEKP